MFSVRYEDILARPQIEFQRMLGFLELPFDPDTLSGLNTVRFKGLYGDPTGITQYQSISKAPLDKWKRVLNNPVRQRWCRQYLNWIGQDRLAVMGYDLDQLLVELKNTPPSLHLLGSDIFRMTFGLLYRLFELRMLRHKFLNAKSWHTVNAHI